MPLPWLTCAEIAAARLPGWPRTAAGVHKRARRHGWQAGQAFPDDPDGRWRRDGDKISYHITLLPKPQQAILAGATAAAKSADSDGEAAPASENRPNYANLMQAWELAGDSRRAAARRRAQVIEEIRALAAAGRTRTEAIGFASGRHGIGTPTLWRWLAAGDGHRGEALAAALLDGRAAGGREPGAMSDDAWRFLLGDYLRLERPNLTDCRRRLVRAAGENGWGAVPSEKAIARRIEREIPAAQRVLARDGIDALKRLYPAQERDRTGLAALEAVNFDGRTVDVFVDWPGVGIIRPCVIGFQDLYSDKILAWRAETSESAAAVRLAFGDLIEAWGIPSRALCDNTRAMSSKWLTGQTPHRFRFKAKDTDVLGLFPRLGVQLSFALPYSGQSKPVERGFRDMSQAIDKHPRFAGAWCGNSPMAKPENYGSRAVPLADFLAVYAEGIAEHNARPGRRTAVCRGEMSFDQAFEQSYRAVPIRRASPWERRLCLLAAEGIRADSVNGSLRLPSGERFWCEGLTAHRGEKLVLRFDPDDLEAGVHVETPAGRYIALAPVIERAGFFDADAAAAHGAARRQWMKAQKAMLEAERTLSVADVARMLPALPAAEPPQPKVVKLVRRTGGPAEPAIDAETAMDGFVRGVGLLGTLKRR